AMGRRRRAYRCRRKLRLSARRSASALRSACGRRLLRRWAGWRCPHPRGVATLPLGVRRHPVEIAPRAKASLLEEAQVASPAAAIAAAIDRLYAGKPIAQTEPA